MAAGSVMRIEGLDALRGMAAVGILVYHTVLILGLYRPSEVGPMFGYLSLAVQLFFAISAFSLCVGYFGKLTSADRLKGFFVRRFLRIAPLFYFMMAVYLTRRIMNGWGLPSYPEIAANALFYFSFIPGYHESIVAAGWSLNVEMIFYLFFPVLLVISKDVKSSVWVFVATMIMSIGASVAFRYWQFAPRYDWLSPVPQAPFFVAGIVMFHAYQWISKRPGTHAKLIASGIFIAVPILVWSALRMGALGLKIGPWSMDRHIMGFLVLPLVLAFALFPVRFLVNRVTVYIGAVSYGIYLIHPWIINVVGKKAQALMKGYGFSDPEVGPAIIGLVAITAVILATVSYFLLERPCMRLVSRKRSVPVVA